MSVHLVCGMSVQIDAVWRGEGYEQRGQFRWSSLWLKSAWLARWLPRFVRIWQSRSSIEAEAVARLVPSFRFNWRSRNDTSSDIGDRYNVLGRTSRLLAMNPAGLAASGADEQEGAPEDTSCVTQTFEAAFYPAAPLLQPLPPSLAEHCELLAAAHAAIGQAHTTQVQDMCVGRHDWEPGQAAHVAAIIQRSIPAPYIHPSVPLLLAFVLLIYMACGNLWKRHKYKMLARGICVAAAVHVFWCLTPYWQPGLHGLRLNLGLAMRGFSAAAGLMAARSFWQATQPHSQPQSIRLPLTSMVICTAALPANSGQPVQTLEGHHSQAVHTHTTGSSSRSGHGSCRYRSAKYRADIWSSTLKAADMGMVVCLHGVAIHAISDRERSSKVWKGEIKHG